ncbi:MAG: glycerol dehydratase reactivase beta/small subunit family protein [Scandinavium sp.]|uniref:glycerol dehydratase reactivase beta/small subunit family protein n=1 Tax=Scandinavium sp. TaxID=2830653 RepID=UPI003F409869
MANSKQLPAIVITVLNNSLALWQEVLFGIEEEGIPFTLREQPMDDLFQCAWQAAQHSPLLVGIACDESTLVVHYKNLPVSAPLYTLAQNQSHLAHRHTGNNAARLVKGLPFREAHSLSTGELQYE